MCLVLNNLCIVYFTYAISKLSTLNTTFLLALFGLSPVCAAIDIVPLTSITSIKMFNKCASLSSHQIDLNIEVLNLI